MRWLGSLLVVLGCSCQTVDETPPPSLVQPENWWDILPRPGYASLDQVGSFGDWFEVYALADGSYAIYEPYQFQEAISYLVSGEERAALIDTGNGIGDIASVVAELTELPVTVLLTHEHPDHFGGAHAFADVAMFDDPQAIARVGAGVANEQARRSVSGEQVWKPLPSGVDPETFAVTGVEPTTLLSDGDVIDLGGRRLEVVHTPGHSPGSVCYLDRDKRVLFTGDHFYPGPLYAMGSGVDIDAYLASNDRLAELLPAYDHVLSGHNEPWVDADVIPRVSEGFRSILDGGGEFSEEGELRRYRFDGFDIIVRKDLLE
jgi:glyoxylase-like metal-dependent hydrolase (beta-lactamase superfamily II)